MQSPLSSAWVDSLFARLAVRYGVDWVRKWEGVPMDAVKADWATELSGMSGESIKYALENLPQDRPPSTAAAFRALSANRPQYVQPQLAAPKADDAVVASAVAKALGPKNDADPKAWAWELRRKEMACVRLTPAQRSMWREALKYELASDVSNQS